MRRGLIAVGLLILLLLLTRGRKLRDGYRARMFLILYSSSQIVLEALRRDSFLRWLFVRVSQLNAALVLLGLAVFGLLRWLRRPEKDRMSVKGMIWNGTLFVLMVPAIIALEFAIDKSPVLSEGLAYLLETGCCAVMGVTVWNMAMKKKKNEQGSISDRGAGEPGGGIRPHPAQRRVRYPGPAGKALSGHPGAQDAPGYFG